MKLPTKLPFFSRRRARPSTVADPADPLHRGGRLHVGAGRERLEGWVNLDIQDLPGVDVVADVTEGLAFRDMEAIYAEHFLEHLRIDDGLNFLADCHRALADGGWLRLSTPNVEWVLLTHYDVKAPEEERRSQVITLNRAFHGWRHRFLWNRPLLGQALTACGFTEVTWCRYGESHRSEFTGLERHETYSDNDEYPHVLIVEARRGPANPAALEDLRQEIGRDFLNHLDD